MKKKEYKLGADARTAIKKVATDMRDIVGKTLGPAGRNYLLPSGITNDGKTIGQQIRYEDECEDNIAIVFMDVAAKTDDEVGDATTTATVVSTTLAITVLDSMPKDDTPIPGMKTVMQVKRELEAESLDAIRYLEEQIEPVESLEDLEKVAQTSMENPVVAKLIAETVHAAGKDSVVSIAEGFGGEVTKTVFPGIRMPLRLAAPYMYTGDRKEAVYEKIPVLVANHIFEEYSEITPFMTDFAKPETAAPGKIVIIAKKFSIPFIGTCANVERASQGKFKYVLLTAELDADQWEDLAAYVDAQLIDTHPKTDRHIASAKFGDTGFVEKIIAGDKQTALIGGRGLTAAVLNSESEPMARVAARVETIRKMAAEESDKPRRKELEKRADELTGGIATIYVDAGTAVERHYLKLKIEDAINACKAALDGGMIPGGGLALKTVAEQLGKGSILYGALMYPYERIQANNGESLPIGDDVKDPFLASKAAIVNSVSAVKVLITTEGIIADHVPDPAGELFKKLGGE